MEDKKKDDKTTQPGWPTGAISKEAKEKAEKLLSIKEKQAKEGKTIIK